MKKKRNLPPHIVLPNGMWRFVKRGSKSVKHSVRRIGTMARRRYGRRRGRSGGFGIGGLVTPKNLMFTLGGAILVPKFVGVSPQIGAGLGSYFGSKNIMTAVISAFAAPIVLDKLGDLGLGGSAPSSGGTIFY